MEARAAIKKRLGINLIYLDTQGGTFKVVTKKEDAHGE